MTVLPCRIAAALVTLALFVSLVRAADEDAGFVPLFNGKDLDGWTVKCKPADRQHECWKVDQGTILADSMDVPKHDYIWLVTNREYGDFILKLKFQAYRGNGGNSGVQVRSRYDDQAGWLDGPQIDIHPSGPWRTGMMWDETRGNQRWIHPNIPAGKWVDESMANPKLKLIYSDEGEGWNQMLITAAGTKIKTVLNGVTITDYDGAGVLDDEAHKKRNVGMKGMIALQIHTGDQLRIRFKDILVKEMGK